MQRWTLKHSWIARALLLAAWTLGLAFIPAQSAHAAACMVTNANDSGAGSLREKVSDSSCTTITFDNDATINLASQLTLSRDMTIDGAGHAVTLSGQSITRVFQVSSTVTINHLTITHGYIDGSSRWYGGAIDNQGNLTVLNSTFTDNSAPHSSYGGAIVNESSAVMTITNSTFTRNNAGYYGGAIYNIGDLTLTNSTLVGNSASSGGGIYSSMGSLTYANTLIANSGGGDCHWDPAWSAISSTHNLVRDGSCKPAITGDPGLGPLTDNGGFTQTYALWPGSPAINAGTNSGCPAADQRGQARPFNANCDIGAYERSDSTSPVVTSFSAPDSSNSLTFPLTAFSGTDAAGLAGYLVTQSTSAPSNLDESWSATPPATVTVGSSGDKILYPWLLDKAGNVSARYGSPATVQVDSIPPDTSIWNEFPSHPITNSTGIIIFFSGYDNYSVASYVCSLDGGSFAPCNGDWSTVGLAEGAHTFRVAAIDWLGNQDASPASYSWQVDTTPPSASIGASIADPSNAAAVRVNVSFSESVTGFTTGSFSVGNGAATSITGSGSTYFADIAPSADGPVTVTVPAGAAQDAAGNANTAANTLAFTSDRTAPAVTIERAAGQADPTGASPVYFTATFSEPVRDFSSLGLTLSGSAGATTATVSKVSATVYRVAVSGMTTGGTVSTAIDPSAAQDLAGNASAASTGSDDTVVFVAGSNAAISASTPADSLVGQPFSAAYMVAAKAPYTGSPSGNVTVSDGVDACSGSIAEGACTLTLTTPGVRTLTAAYSGDALFSASASAGLLHTVNQAPAFTSPASADFQAGAQGSFSISLTGYPKPSLTIAGSHDLPGGLSLVTPGDGATRISGTPDVGTGGAYPFRLTASNGVGADVEQTLTLTVEEDPAITSANYASFRAGVSGNYSVRTRGYPRPTLSVTGALPAGVTFQDAGDGSAEFRGVPAAGTDGVYSLTLVADTGTGAPASQSFNLVVGKISATLQVVPAASGSIYGQEVTFLAVLSSGVTTPTGSVTFEVDGVTVGAAVPLVDGVALLSTQTLSSGPHTIRASYGGDGLHEPCQAASAQPFVVAPASTALSLAFRWGWAPETPTQMTVTVSAVAPGAGTPSGQVSVYEGDQLLGSGTLDGSGRVVIAVSSIGPNPHAFLVQYGGDGNFTASQQVFERSVYFLPAVFNGGSS